MPLTRITLKPDPLGVPRDGFAVYLLLICALSGLSNLAGVTTAGSIESELHPLARMAWGAMLTLGATCVLAGMFWQGDQRTGLVVKRFGCASLFFTSVIYTAVLLASYRNDAAMVAGFVAGFAVVCARRWWQVEKAISAIVEKSP